MNNFKKPFNKFGGKKFGGQGRFDRGGDRGFDRQPVELFHAICANCGKSCQVPFKPNGKKPVFCKECFDAGAAGDTVAPRQDRGDRQDARPVRQYEGPRKDFASVARPQPAPASSGLTLEIKKELEGVNQKLAQLIELLAPKPKKASKKKSA